MSTTDTLHSWATSVSSTDTATPAAMDPATAIGVSSAVLSFVDFGAKIVRGAFYIYGATDSATEWQNPRDVAAKMHQLARRMRVPTTQELSYDEEELCELAGKCQALSQELAKLFGTMLPKNSKSKRQCLWTAAKLKLKDDEVRGLEKRLESCREQLELHLTYANYLTGTDMKASLQQLLDQQDASSRKLIQSTEDLKDCLKRIEEDETKPLNPDALAQIQSAVQIQSELIDAAVSSRILAGLAFSSMNSRYNGIEDAHASTFRWFFDENSDTRGSDDGHDLHEAQAKAKDLFTDWLVKPNSGILHISGKLGSGKSTLMKFLADQPETRAGLQEWAGDHTLVFASFFFWKAGLPEQRSLSGLIRTLLHDSLSSDSTLIPLLLPDLWATTRKDGWLAQSPVTLTDLQIREAFERLISSPRILEDKRFCFFIDGLDEYEGSTHMDHRDMVNMLNRWSTTKPQRVKICVSSREDNVFMKAFEAEMRIRIHELTKNDMHEFVSSRLSYIFPAQDSRAAEAFAGDIVRRAEGIFLWVTLAVKEIRRRHDNSDTGDLKEFLEYLPLDLEDLFRYMIFELIPREDRPMAHRTFSIAFNAQAQDVRLTLWELSFIKEYVKDPNFCIKCPRESVKTHGEAVRGLEPAMSWVRAWCRGLLEVGPDNTNDNGTCMLNSLCIGFSHRSISEFLATEETKAESRKWITGWNWIDAYSKMYLASCQAFSAFRLNTHLTNELLKMRNVAGLDLEPPFEYLTALDRCYHPKYDEVARRLSQKRAGIVCHLPPFLSISNCHVGSKLIYLPMTPSAQIVLLDGDHPYPSWRLGQDKTLKRVELLVTTLYFASIANSRTLFPMRSYGIHPRGKGYRFLDLLAEHSDMKSRLLPGFRMEHSYYEDMGTLHGMDAVGVLGQYLVLWFIRCCWSHPRLQNAVTVRRMIGGWDLSELLDEDTVEGFGAVLERLFQIDPGRLRLEAHVSLGYLADRSVTEITFVIGDLVQRPKWTTQTWRLGGDISGYMSTQDYSKDTPEISEQESWTLEDIINITNPPNRDTLLKMIDERNSALPDLATLRLDDKITSEETCDQPRNTAPPSNTTSRDAEQS